MTTVESDNHVPDFNSISSDTAAKITAKLIVVLEGEFGTDNDVLDTIRPLIPAVVEYGLKEGKDAAIELLVGLGQDDSYEYWQRLIEVADPETRIELMKQGRQAAMLEQIKKVERDEVRWKVFKVAIQVAIGLLGLLLV